MHPGSRWDSKSGKTSRISQLGGCLAVVGLTAAVGCGATSRATGGEGADHDGSSAGTSASAGGTGGGLITKPGGGSTDAAVDLSGAPEYLRFVRLTNTQWASSVREVLQLTEPAGLETDFEAPVMGVTDFSNNEQLLEVDSRSWADFQAASEVLSERATASDDALRAMYSGTDVAGFIQTVGRRAYRRPLTSAEVDKYSELFASGASMEGDKSEFAKGAALVIRALLQSPNFLYRSELGASGDALSGYEAAAKLSLWLRNTTPDDVLLDDAEQLTSADALAERAMKMIGEATAIAVMRQFHGELMHLDRLSQISKVGVPGYDPALNAEYLESSYLFFDRIFSKNQGVREILTSTRGFMGNGMAALYGLPSSRGGFVERELGTGRSGYFSQLPFLTVHAINAEPHSFHRGLALAVDVLCRPFAAPPAAVPPPAERDPHQTNRQYLDGMTAACGSACHTDAMNPLGFAFEHFDGMGQYRETEASGLPIDSHGSYLFNTGKVDFDDNVELLAAIAESPEAHLCYAKKLASFALQRDIVASDLPWLNPLASLSRDDAGSTQQLMIALVKSDAFRTHHGAP